MSPDPEDSALEEALRGDLPPPEASARMRRRLLAAGLAVGNGVAVTSAAAASASPGVVAGLVSKGLALSWGVKLGVLAVVAIPSVGLLVESQAEPQLAAPPANVAAPASSDRSPERATELAPPVTPNVEVGDALPPAARGAVARDAKITASEAGTPPDADPSAPSQGDFASAEAAVAARAASTLAEETRILDSALAELAMGRSARAAELIAEHQRRFPAGLLQQERERARARLNEMSRGE